MEGVSCPYCYHNLSEYRKTRFEERQKQMMLAKKRNHQHLGQSIEQEKVRKKEAKLLADQKAQAGLS